MKLDSTSTEHIFKAIVAMFVQFKRMTLQKYSKTGFTQYSTEYVRRRLMSDLMNFIMNA